MEKKLKSSNIQVLPIEETKVIGNRIWWKTKENVFDPSRQYGFRCIAGTDVEQTEFDMEVLGEDTIQVDLSNFIKMAENLQKVSAKWRCYITFLDQGEYRAYRCKEEKIEKQARKKKKDYYDLRFKFFNPLEEKLTDDRRLVPYYTDNGYFGIIKTSEEGVITQSVQNKMVKLRLSGKSIHIVWECADLGMEITGAVFRLRTKKMEEGEFILPVQILSRENGKLLVECKAEIPIEVLTPMFWDCSLAYEKGTKRILIGSSNADSDFQKECLDDFFGKNTIHLEKNRIFYPYMTVKGRVAFQCREEEKYDKIGFRIKERLAALIYFLSKKRLAKKNIYLVYEKFCEMAQDNGYYFFQYCMEHGIEESMGKKIYYIIDKNSPDYEKLKKYGKNVISFMSMKHIVYLLASKLLITTDNRDHAYIWRSRGSILRKYWESKKVVFLQHGVIALKRCDFLYSAGNRAGCDLFITSNDMERDIVVKYFGYKKNQIAVTGLSRWDVLKDKSEGRREILIMPTWRNWLDEVEKESFRESEYYKNYMELLNSSQLKNLLRQYDITLNFYLHPKFKEYIDHFHAEGERIHLIAFGEEQLNELMMRCKLLVTDYSSVSWDVFYQGKPVIFYQFDTEQYLISHGSYIDFETDLFGDRAENKSELLSVLKEYMENNFQLKDQYAKLRKDYYKYIDDENSKRICEEIRKRKW